MSNLKMNKFREILSKYKLPTPTKNLREIIGFKLIDRKGGMGQSGEVHIYNNGKSLFLTSDYCDLDEVGSFINYHDLNHIRYHEQYLKILSSEALHEYRDLIRTLELKELEEKDKIEFERIKKKYKW